MKQQQYQGLYQGFIWQYGRHLNTNQQNWIPNDMMKCFLDATFCFWTVEIYYDINTVTLGRVVQSPI